MTTQLLRETDLARILGKAPVTIRRWRLLAQGPRFLRIGRNIRYRPEDLERWLETRPSGGEQGRGDL